MLFRDYEHCPNSRCKAQLKKNNALKVQIQLASIFEIAFCKGFFRPVFGTYTNWICRNLDFLLEFSSFSGVFEFRIVEFSKNRTNFEYNMLFFGYILYFWMSICIFSEISTFFDFIVHEFWYFSSLSFIVTVQKSLSTCSHMAARHHMPSERIRHTVRIYHTVHSNWNVKHLKQLKPDFTTYQPQLKYCGAASKIEEKQQKLPLG